MIFFSIADIQIYLKSSHTKVGSGVSVLISVLFAKNQRIIYTINKDEGYYILLGEQKF